MTVGKYVCCSKNNSKEYCIQHFPILFSTHSLTLFLLHTLTLSGEFDPNASTNAACYGDIAGDGGEGIDKSVEFGFDFGAYGRFAGGGGGGSSSDYTCPDRSVSICHLIFYHHCIRA